MRAIAVMYLLLIPVTALFIYTKHRDMKRLSVVLKALCTGIILLTGLAGLQSSPEEAGTYAAMITAGLAFGLAGDVAICFRFPLGMLFFGLGHFCYIAAMFRVTAHPLWSVPIFIVLYLLLLVLYRKIRLPFGKLLVPSIVYSLIITIMLSLAATIPFSAIPGGCALFLGAALFSASDGMLAMTTFGRFDKKLDAVCLCCYFLGQSLFAVSIFCLR